MRVVASADEQAAIGREPHAARVMAALAPLFIEAQNLLLARHVQPVAVHPEATQALAYEVRRRIEQVNPLVLRELRIEGETKQTILLLGEHRNGPGLDDLAARLANFQHAAQFVEKDPAIRRELQQQRLRHSSCENFDLVAVVGRDFCCPCCESENEHNDHRSNEPKRVKRLFKHDAVDSVLKFPNPDVAIAHGISVILQHERPRRRHAFQRGSSRGLSFDRDVILHEYAVVQHGE